MQTPAISLEQWRCLMAVVDHGGYAQAAQALNKSQSAVTYAVQKIESLLDVKAFLLQGRKAVLTPTGALLYRRARALLEESCGLERAARGLAAGWEAEITLAVEILFPTWLLFDCLAQLGGESPDTRIEIVESVIGGTNEALLQRRADLAIAPLIPPGFLGTPLMMLKVIPVAHPDHPLHHLGRPAGLTDLSRHRHLIVRDSGSVRDRRALSVEVEQRWTVSHIATSIEAVSRGHGFAWLPEERIRAELAAGSLAPLAVEGGSERLVTLYLILADPDFAGPGVRRLAEIILAQAAAECPLRRGALPLEAPQRFGHSA
jgi:DNA-binding transcriptional LysR family regulator